MEYDYKLEDRYRIRLLSEMWHQLNHHYWTIKGELTKADQERVLQNAANWTSRVLLDEYENVAGERPPWRLSK